MVKIEKSIKATNWSKLTASFFVPQPLAWFSDLLVDHCEIFFSLFIVDMNAVLDEQPPNNWDSFSLFQVLNNFLVYEGKDKTCICFFASRLLETLGTLEFSLKSKKAGHLVPGWTLHIIVQTFACFTFACFTFACFAAALKIANFQRESGIQSLESRPRTTWRIPWSH